MRKSEHNAKQVKSERAPNKRVRVWITPGNRPRVVDQNRFVGEPDKGKTGPNSCKPVNGGGTQNRPEENAE
jgi:hypothetical protein